MGVTLSAGVGLGVWSSFKEAAGTLETETETVPDPQAFALYDRFYGIYKGF